MEDYVNQYALSLIDLAKEDNNHLTLTEFYDDIKAVMNVFEVSEELIVMLKSIQLTNKDKKNIIKEVFCGQIHPMVVNFIKILIDDDELCHITIICQRFIDLCHTDKEIKVATILSKELLLKEEMLNIVNSLKAVSEYYFVLINKLDPNVELEVMLDDMRFDITEGVEGGGIGER